MKTFYGMEVPDDMSLTHKAKAALRRFKSKGFVVVQRDDSPNGYMTFDQLMTIAGNIGIDYLTTPYTLIMYDGSTPVLVN